MNTSLNSSYRSANGPQQQQYTMNGMNGVNGANTPLDRRERPQAQQHRPTVNPINTSSFSIVIQNLPLTINVDSLRNMVVWSEDFIGATILPQENESKTRSAVLEFGNRAAAEYAQSMLHGKPNVNKDAKMVVDLCFTGRQSLSGENSSAASSAVSSSDQFHSARFNGHQARDRISPTNGFHGNELPRPSEYGGDSRYQQIFSPQSPIGNHLTTRITGKSLINNDSTDDDETGELLKDPILWAENGNGLGRRSTLPHLPMRGMSALTLNTANGNGNGNGNGHPQHMSAFPQQNMGIHGHGNGIGNPMSPMGNVPPPGNYQIAPQHYNRPNYPPVNPADQNPPCNTLYVGNLPIDTSEDELKAIFSKQRGYKRLCFRTKQNGPMCFVEFEDISFATKALHELYGQPLHNSVKGGIRLSFSKNPLGVRSGAGMVGMGNGGANGAGGTNGMMHMNGMMNGGNMGAFATANGPPLKLQEKMGQS